MIGDKNCQWGILVYWADPREDPQEAAINGEQKTISRLNRIELRTDAAPVQKQNKEPGAQRIEPAVERADGDKEWYRDGKEYDPPKQLKTYSEYQAFFTPEELAEETVWRARAVIKSLLRM